MVEQALQVFFPMRTRVNRTRKNNVGKWHSGALSGEARNLTGVVPYPDTKYIVFVTQSRASAMLGLQRPRAPTCFSCSGAGHKFSTFPGLPDGACYTCFKCGSVSQFALACLTRASAARVLT